MIMNVAGLMGNVCRACEVSEANLLSRSRRREVVIARQMICYELRRRGYTYSAIGEVVGRDHATAIYSEKKFREMLVFHDRLAIDAYDRFKYFSGFGFSTGIRISSGSRVCCF